MDLSTFWFLLVGGLLTGYAVFDGFDLGTGPLLLCARSDHERRVFLNAIGPTWNGNEVWLVTGGGALFAAFPQVFATVLLGFYDVFMLMLTALIFRAAAIEFRSQRPGALWRTTWDAAFAISSVLSALLLGVAVGNIIWGIPPDSAREFQGNLVTLLHPYALFNNSASTRKTLGFMFVVAIIGVPIVLTYTITVYYVFRGKVVLTEESY
jgi:cytochrome d ubiquinol oxidase subunit II